MLVSQILNAVYSHHMNHKAKKRKERESVGYSNDLAWVFISSNPSELFMTNSYRTITSLRKQARTKDLYITCNGFWRNDKRDKGSVRWINSINLDFDGMNRLEVLDAIERAGLPFPTFLNDTPSGGCHAWYVIEGGIRNSKNNKARVLVEEIQKSMAKSTGADMKAIGIERWWRIPHSDTIYIPGDYLELVNIQELIDWREINCPEDIEKNQNEGFKGIRSKGILNQSFFKNLLKGADEGQRNHACYTLALAMKWDKIELNMAIERLLEWNSLNTPAMGTKELIKCVKSAYFSKYNGPSTKYCLDIFGETFTYKTWIPTPAKAREERERTHIEEWANDIVELLKESNRFWEGSQRELAIILNAPLRSIQMALEVLKNRQIIQVDIKGKGRGSKTYISLICNAENEGDETYILPKAAGGEFMPFIKYAYFSTNKMTHTYNNTIDRWEGGASP